MSLFWCAAGLAAVTVVYLYWRSYRVALGRRQSVLRERIALMLWVMADPDDDPDDKNPAEVDSPADVA